MLWETHLSDGSLDGVAPANFYDWRQQSRSFDKMAAKSIRILITFSTDPVQQNV